MAPQNLNLMDVTAKEVFIQVLEHLKSKVQKTNTYSMLIYRQIMVEILEMINRRKEIFYVIKVNMQITNLGFVFI